MQFDKMAVNHTQMNMTQGESLPLMAATDDEEDMNSSNDVIDTSDMPRLNDPDTPEEEKQKKRLQTYNLLGVSVIAMLWSTVAPIHYNDLSTVWRGHEHVGFSNTTFLCQITFLLAFAVSTYLSPVVIPFLGARRTMLLGTTNLIALSIVHFFTQPYLLIAAYGLVGFQMNFFYTSLSVCCSQLAQRFCNIKLTASTNYDRIHMLFYGVFHAFLLGGPLLRTLFIVLLLKPGAAKSPLSESCGIKLCPEFLFGFDIKSIDVPDSVAHRIQGLLSGLLTMAVIAALIVVTCLYMPHKVEFLVNLPKRCGATRRSFAYLLQLKFILLIPAFLLIGSNQAFLYTVASQAYMGCVWHEKWSEYFILALSGSSFLSSIPLALLTHTLGRIRVLFVTFALNLGVYLVLFLVHPGEDNTPVIFGLAILSGCLDAVLQTQFSALVSKLFWNCRITSHCSFRMWQIVGILLVVSLHRFLCVLIALSTCLALLLLASISYLILEIRLRLKQQEPRRKRLISLRSLDEGGWLPKLDPHSNNNTESLAATTIQ